MLYDTQMLRSNSETSKLIRHRVDQRYNELTVVLMLATQARKWLRLCRHCTRSNTTIDVKTKNKMKVGITFLFC